MFLISTVLAAAAIAVAPVPAQAPAPEVEQWFFECTSEECTHLAVPVNIMAAVARTNQRLVREHNAMRAELEKLRAIKGCGKLEILPPPKRERGA